MSSCSEEGIGLLETRPAEVDKAMAEAEAGDGDELSVVQFGMQMYFCTEDEGEVEVQVVRLGSARRQATFDYETRNGSATVGVKYERRGGAVTFSPGETTKTLRIPIIQDERWDATLDFAICILRVRGAQLGHYLHTCRVSIIDDDTFPTNKHHAELRDGRDVESVSDMSLMAEYFKMNMSRDEVMRRTLVCILADLFKSFYYFMTLYLQLYLVDVVIMGGEPEEDRRLLSRVVGKSSHLLSRCLGESSASDESDGAWDVELESRRCAVLVVGLLYVCPLLLLQWVDNCKARWEVGTVCRKILQSNLFRRFLNYKETTPSHISTSDKAMAVLRDVKEVVELGYEKVLQVARIIFKLALASVFMLAENKSALVPLAVFPIVMTAFLVCRGRVTIQTNENVAQSENRMAQTLNSAIMNSRLVADFDLRPFLVHRFEQDIDRFNRATIACRHVMVNNVYVVPWLTTLSIGAWMVFGTFEVEALGGPLSLGTFLATINIFKEIGLELEEVYHGIIEIQAAAGPLRKLTYFMNFPTDLEHRMRICRERIQNGETRRAYARSVNTSDGHAVSPELRGVLPVDTIPVELMSLTFSRNNLRVVDDLTWAFEQGLVHAFVGPTHQGKATILKLIGQVLNPEHNSGSVLVPPNLRVLHVSQETYVLNESLLMNVTLDADLDKLGGFERVRQICEGCGFTENTLKFLHAPAEESEPSSDPQSSTPRMHDSWASQLSLTQRARLNFARALVINPECLVMHMPVISFGDADALAMMKLIRAHSDERGIVLPDGDRRSRRPRTVFCSSNSVARCAVAHAVYEVSSGTLVELPMWLRENQRAHGISKLRTSALDSKAGAAEGSQGPPDPDDRDSSEDVEAVMSAGHRFSGVTQKLTSLSKLRTTPGKGTSPKAIPRATASK